MNNVFVIDCEFNGFGGELISMALVSETGEEFYEVLWVEEDYDPWVIANVLPVREKDPIPYEEFQDRLRGYLLDNCGDYSTIIADWPDDIRYFCEALIIGPGIMMTSPSHMNFIVDRTLSSSGSEVPHNALHDARAIMKQIK